MKRAALAFLAVLALSPFYFVLYRLALFDTVPHDDYAPYLLWLAGAPHGVVPDSPYAYRLLSVAAAWPFYRLLPVLSLTNQPAGLSVETMRAIAALSMLSFTSLLATGGLMAWLGRKEGLNPGAAACAGGVAMALIWHTQVTAIDPLALLFITAGLCAVRRPWLFAALLAVSIGVNEKIAMVLAAWLAARVVFGPDRRWAMLPALQAIVAVLLYGALVLTLRLPGNAYQLTPGGYFGTISENLAAYATARGLLLNIMPSLVLFTIAGIGHRQIGTGLFRRTDIWAIPAMLLVALVLTQFYQAGRLVMHTAPLFVIPLMAALQARDEPRKPSHDHG
jgi:hypothetical protein